MVLGVNADMVVARTVGMIEVVDSLLGLADCLFEFVRVQVISGSGTSRV